MIPRAKHISIANKTKWNNREAEEIDVELHSLDKGTEENSYLRARGKWRLWITRFVIMEWNRRQDNAGSFNNGKQMVLLKDQVFRSQQEQNFFSSPKIPIDCPPNFALTASRGFSSEVNWPQREADYPLFQVLILIIRYISLFSLYGIMLWTEIYLPLFLPLPTEY